MSAGDVGVVGKSHGAGIRRRPEDLVDLLVAEARERPPVRLDASDERADDVVGLPERHAALDERVRDRGRGRVAVGGRRAHPRLVHAKGRHEAGHHPQRCERDRDPVEERRLVLLEVALVAAGQAP